MRKRNIFQTVSALRPGKSVFDLSYAKIFTCDMGNLIPVLCDIAVPGDYWKIGCEAVVRFMPLVAPILHQIDLYYHVFFVPNRLMWNAETNDETSDTGTWEDYITSGETGTDASSIPEWSPADSTSENTLWDYMGMPLIADPDGYLPHCFPQRAYNITVNEFYRDENLQTAIALDNDDIINRCWEKDYFTSALTAQQKGTAPSLPLSGTTNAEWASASFDSHGSSLDMVGYRSDVDNTPYMAGLTSANARFNAENMFEANTVDFSDATTFDVADLRLAFQIQKWMERNARAGTRYVEYLRSHYNVSPRDDRLQRPEYIGGTKARVILSEVLQTSETNTTPQGTLAGHGLGVVSAYCGKYHVKEHGVIIGIMSIMPKPVYSSQGINRQWRYQSRYEFYSPEFANLSEQPIERGELFATTGASATSEQTFGYQGRFDELRTKTNMIVGEMRSTYDYWHLARQLTSATLNSAFVECTPRKDIFAAPSEPGLLVQFGNLIKAWRPIPVQAEPGLIDH